MAAFAESFPAIKNVLAQHYGRPKPALEGLAKFERVIAAGVLGPGLGHPRRSSAIVNALDRAGLGRPEVLAGAELFEIADALNEVGARLPTKAVAVLQRLARWFTVEFPTCVEFEDRDDDGSHAGAEVVRLREELAAQNGIGPARADAILLALGLAVYPVDRGTFRILVRHGWIDAWASYDEARELLSRQLGHSPTEIETVAHGMTEVGRRFCKPRAPECQACPLAPFLPEREPLEPDF
ncbi:MAG: endonuclease III [Isosphaeraceae bacterium]